MHRWLKSMPKSELGVQILAWGGDIPQGPTAVNHVRLVRFFVWVLSQEFQFSDHQKARPAAIPSGFRHWNICSLPQLRQRVSV